MALGTYTTALDVGRCFFLFLEMLVAQPYQSKCCFLHLIVHTMPMIYLFSFSLEFKAQ